MSGKLSGLCLALLLTAGAAVIDRVAVVVGTTVITETEVLQEARLEAFLNQSKLDLGPEQRKAAAERLVDQQLVRNEMSVGSYPKPAEAEVEDMLRRLRQEQFGGEAQYREALTKYGVTEDQVKNYLMWQLAAIRFTDLRFGATDSKQQSANRAKSDSAVPANDVDQQLDAWLKEARTTVKVKFRPEAFQ
jgi:hypothetical protein